MGQRQSPIWLHTCVNDYLQWEHSAALFVGIWDFGWGYYLVDYCSDNRLLHVPLALRVREVAIRSIGDNYFIKFK